MNEKIVEELVVKSRDRVKTYGEVFTPHHMIGVPRISRTADLMVLLRYRDFEEQKSSSIGWADQYLLRQCDGRIFLRTLKNERAHRTEYSINRLSENAWHLSPDRGSTWSRSGSASSNA